MKTKSGTPGLLLAASFVLSGAYADITWNGKDQDLNADWSLASNWSGGVAPTGGAAVFIDRNGNHFRALGFTPPIDFTGTINVNADATDWDTWSASRVRLEVLDGATWTVIGGGFVYATDNIAGRIASTFTGTIIIPKGSSFIAPSTLNSAVKFAGDGRLTVTTTTQLSRLGAFTGTLVWGGAGNLRPDDTIVLQGRTIELANGSSIVYDKRYLTANAALEIKDWNDDPDSWNMASVTKTTSSKYTLDTRPPHANADGSLALVNDAAQIHSATYTGRKLKWYDAWGVSFRYTPALPSPSKFTEAGAGQQFSGTFGVYMTTNLACNASYVYPVATGGGFRIYHYGQNLYWYRGDQKDSVPVSQTDLTTAGGVNLREPMDITVSCQDGILTYTMRQGEKYFVNSRSFNDKYTMSQTSDGYYISFGASSDWWNDGEDIPWSTHIISNFKGWYRAREAGRWVDEGRTFYPFDSNNATARNYTDASTYDADSFPNGAFQLETYGTRTRNILFSTHTYRNDRPYLVNFDLVNGQGTNAENTQYTKFGFTKAEGRTGNWVYKEL